MIPNNLFSVPKKICSNSQFATTVSIYSSCCMLNNNRFIKVFSVLRDKLSRKVTSPIAQKFFLSKVHFFSSEIHSFDLDKKRLATMKELLSNSNARCVRARHQDFLQVSNNYGVRCPYSTAVPLSLASSTDLDF